MHELSVAQNIIDIVKENVPDTDYKHVNKILLEVGEFSGIVADSLLYCFDVIKSDTDFLNTKMEIKKIPFILFCNSCKTETTNNAGIRMCNICGGYDTKIISGIDMKIIEVEVNT
ncbi:MAG: hydrogenase maturation nickel metallochaperone HypA [Ignavibacteriae bacterium]|nr:hydrogenase maturation nickel metallochaperone HypA [Ignavibacteriota bacterium]